MEMAKKVTVSFVDDLDGKTAADETVAFTLYGVALRDRSFDKECQETPRGVQPLDRGRTACRGTTPKLDRRREQDSDRATRVRSHPRMGAYARLSGSPPRQDPS